MRFARATVAIWLVLATLITSGCAASSKYMTELTILPLEAPADQALVAFLRPSSLGFAVKFAIVDSRGRYLGDALSSGYFAVPVEAGSIAIYAAGENDSALKGEVAAGRTYYVLVDPNVGAFSARVDLLPIKPGTEHWGKRHEWLSSSTPYRVNLAAAQSELTQAEMKERLEGGEQAWKGYDAEERAEHTLSASDCEQPVKARTPPPPPASPSALPAEPAAPQPASARVQAPPAAALHS